MLDTISVLGAGSFCNDVLVLVTLSMEFWNVFERWNNKCWLVLHYLHLSSSITHLPSLQDEAEYAKYNGDRGVEVHGPGTVRVLHDNDGIIEGRQREGNIPASKWSHGVGVFGSINGSLFGLMEYCIVQGHMKQSV